MFVQAKSGPSRRAARRVRRAGTYQLVLRLSSSLLGQASQPLTPVSGYDISNVGSSRQHRSHGLHALPAVAWRVHALSAGFAPPVVPQPNARCSPVTPVLMCGSYEQHLLSLKGALLGPLYPATGLVRATQRRTSGDHDRSPQACDIAGTLFLQVKVFKPLSRVFFSRFQRSTPMTPVGSDAGVSVKWADTNKRQRPLRSQIKSASASLAASLSICRWWPPMPSSIVSRPLSVAILARLCATRYWPGCAPPDTGAGCRAPRLRLRGRCAGSSCRLCSCWPRPRSPGWCAGPAVRTPSERSRSTTAGA